VFDSRLKKTRAPFSYAGLRQTLIVPDFSARFGLEKMRSGNAAVYQLKEQFEKFATSPQKVDVCESIADCFYQLEQFDDAANWYETAGRLILSEPSSTPALKALSALGEYERALDAYGKAEDDEGFTECSSLIRQLERACASA
jgi:tetratricopeptide (TPR) repeat protein